MASSKGPVQTPPPQRGFTPGPERSRKPSLPTVLMSARAWRATPGGGGEEAALLLQLSVGPESAREFRLSVRRSSGLRTVVAEYNLKDVFYKMKNSMCHELIAVGKPDSCMVFNFDDEREAQQWWTVVSSSLREVQKTVSAVLHNHGNPFRTGPPVLDKPMISDIKMPFTPSLSTETPMTPTDMSTKEDLSLRLGRSIENGDQQTASQCAVALAKQQVPLQIQLKQICYPKTEICMKVGVEDATGSANISIYVQVHTTIAMLKQQMFQEYQFHPSVQRWIIGQCLCSDDRTVASYGIKRDGDTSFLYLLSAKQGKLNPQDQYSSNLLHTHSLLPGPSLDDKQKSNTLPNRPTPKNAINTRQAENDIRLAISDDARNLHLEIQHLNSSSRLPGNLPIPAAPPSPAQTGWSCSVCTFINKPTRPGCEMCSTDRPSNYIIPEEYTPDEIERKRLQQERDSMLQYNKGKGRREDGSSSHQDHHANSLEDFTILSA